MIFALSLLSTPMAVEHGALPNQRMEGGTLQGLHKVRPKVIRSLTVDAASP
jgi:hypothetical protein